MWDFALVILNGRCFPCGHCNDYGPTASCSSRCLRLELWARCDLTGSRLAQPNLPRFRICCRESCKEATWLLAASASPPHRSPLLAAKPSACGRSQPSSLDHYGPEAPTRRLGSLAPAYRSGRKVSRPLRGAACAGGHPPPIHVAAWPRNFRNRSPFGAYGQCQIGSQQTIWPSAHRQCGARSGGQVACHGNGRI